MPSRKKLPTFDYDWASAENAERTFEIFEVASGKVVAYADSHDEAEALLAKLEEKALRDASAGLVP